MTNRDSIRRQIAKCRQRMIPAMIMTIAGFIAAAITTVQFGNTIGAIGAAIALFGFIIWISAIISISNTVRCPSCGNRLGYLLLDPSYSRTFAPIAMPKDIPSNIVECPYCHTDFGNKMAEPAPAPYSSPAAGSESGEA